MSKKLALTLACGDYEIVRALRDGSVAPDGIELNVLTDMDSTTRHWRMLRNSEFDVCELSLSSYLIAKATGRPFAAIPVFLHRRFRHGFAFVNSAAGIRSPCDLIGRKVGVKTYQATAILWMRGILEHDHGVPHREVEWVSELDEDVEFTPPPGLRLVKAPAGRSVEAMLPTGEVAAVLSPDLIDPFVEGDPRVRRLFEDHKAVEIDYFRRTGIFPIMHVTAIRQEIVDRYPWVPINLQRAFEAAKRAAYRRLENPRIVPLAWYREAWEEQQALLGPDPWVYGLGDQNRKNIETAVGYSYEQGMIDRRLTMEELFLTASEGRGRGERKRI